MATQARRVMAMARWPPHTQAAHCCSWISLIWSTLCAARWLSPAALCARTSTYEFTLLLRIQCSPAPAVPLATSLLELLVARPPTHIPSPTHACTTPRHQRKWCSDGMLWLPPRVQRAARQAACRQDLQQPVYRWLWRAHYQHWHALLQVRPALGLSGERSGEFWSAEITY